MDISNKSIVQWFDEREGHSCGYCKSPKGSISYGMWAETLTVEDYQELIDRGFRRSGKYCYKPIMDKTCCPQYTIMCEAVNFQLSKSHKKIIKRFNKFLNDGVFNKNDVPSEGICVEKNEDIDVAHIKKGSFIIDEHNLKINCTETSVESDKNEINIGDVRVEENIESKPTTSSAESSFKKILGADGSKPVCRKAKLMRIERKKAKMLEKGMDFEIDKNKDVKQKSLKEFLEDIPRTAKHKLKLKVVPVHKIESTESIKREEFELYEKYQNIVHDDKDVTMTKFLRFLVTSPLKPKNFPNNVQGPGYGSFHQQYFVDDKLIAVGVVDILPKSISSVYFFYDPDYRSLTLGTYGSLRELHFTRCLQQNVPQLKYYYMGFYIHSCPKMRYKGRLVPSYLACPETYQWVRIESCLGKLDKSKYSRLTEDEKRVDVNKCDIKDVDKIKIVDSRVLYNCKEYVRINKDAKKVYDMVGKLIGKNCINSMIFWEK